MLIRNKWLLLINQPLIEPLFASIGRIRSCIISSSSCGHSLFRTWTILIKFNFNILNIRSWPRNRILTIFLFYLLKLIKVNTLLFNHLSFFSYVSCLLCLAISCFSSIFTSWNIVFKIPCYLAIFWSFHIFLIKKKYYIYKTI